MYKHPLLDREKMTPAQALELLTEGNNRFTSNISSNKDLLQVVNLTKDQQHPFTAILSCSDSRTSTELIFDQSLGDIFSVKLAGNIANDDFEKGFKDQRVGLHAILYPQPFGIQAEWNWGEGPQLSDDFRTIETESLNGGYIQAMYMFKDFYGYGVVTPFVRWQYFDGGQKFETNAPRNRVEDWELGFEWQPNKEIEFTVYYAKLDRTNVNTAPYDDYSSDLLRMQLQYNF